MNNQKRILCIGEILWDFLPAGLFLGGALLNISFHLHQLGENVKIVSRVGNDRLGQEAVRRIKHKNLPTDFIQQDDNLETGIVQVELDEQGNPEYTFIDPVAWDNIRLTEQMETEVQDAWAVVFGSLALRNPQSREAISTLLDYDTLKVFDVNFRKPFYSKQLIGEYLPAADILKLNEEELRQIIEWFSLTNDEQKAVEIIADRFSCQTIAVTKGRAGATLFHNGTWAEHSGFRVSTKDAVGAGDAFLAALLHGIKMGNDIEQILMFANAAGAYVASQSGATPAYSTIEIAQLMATSSVG